MRGGTTWQSHVYRKTNLICLYSKIILKMRLPRRKNLLAMTGRGNANVGGVISMKYVLATLLFVTLSISITYILQKIFYKKIIIEDRMKKLQSGYEIESKALKYIFYKKLIKNLYEKVNKNIYGLMPNNIKERIQLKLQKAGIIHKVDAYKWITIKLIVAVIIPSIYVIALYQKDGIDSKNLFIWVIVTGILYALPNLFLEQIIQKRKKQIEKELPDVLDLLTVSVEAGLSFDNSILKLTDKMKGVLIDEFSKYIAEMKIGKTRKEALQGMQRRIDVDDVTTFTGALIQAYELGISISNVVKIQSKQMREKRRQRAQEIAMKAPVKMLFPLIFFIFPSIFIILLGPAVLRMIKAFSGE
ncbi:MAG TPA: secretion system protein [Clostridiales bacterium]|nr:secretion system protein [Clostridiales bacterium]